METHLYCPCLNPHKVSTGDVKSEELNSALNRQKGPLLGYHQQVVSKEQAARVQGCLKRYDRDFEEVIKRQCHVCVKSIVSFSRNRGSPKTVQCLVGHQTPRLVLCLSTQKCGCSGDQVSGPVFFVLYVLYFCG